MRISSKIPRLSYLHRNDYNAVENLYQRQLAKPIWWIWMHSQIADLVDMIAMTSCPVM